MADVDNTSDECLSRLTLEELLAIHKIREYKLGLVRGQIDLRVHLFQVYEARVQRQTQLLKECRATLLIQGERDLAQRIAALLEDYGEDE